MNYIVPRILRRAFQGLKQLESFIGFFVCILLKIEL